jgi:hypothetical protein
LWTALGLIDAIYFDTVVYAIANHIFLFPAPNADAQNTTPYTFAFLSTY